MHDVIDLLSSSPELPVPRVIKKTATSAPAPAQAQAVFPSKTLNHKTSTLKDCDRIDLSSDISEGEVFLPPPKQAPKPSSVSIGSITAAKLPSLMNTSGASNGIFFRSDDFDSTINLDDDDPFASDPPPAKKQRLSPAPNPSIITRSPGTSGCKRSSSDIGALSKSAALETSVTGVKRSKTMGVVLASDPIVFTSSPDAVADARKRRQKQTKANINAILECSGDDGIFDSSPRMEATMKAKSNGSDALGTSQRGVALRNLDFGSSDIDLPDLGAIPSQAKSKLTATSKTSRKSAAVAALDNFEIERAKETKREEKEQLAKNKIAAKEAEKEQKRIAKEQKARGKDRAAELAKVNTLRTDKKKSTPEMIVDLPSCLDKRFTEQIQTFLKPVEAQHTQYENTLPILKWRRVIDSEFDKEADHWEKVDSYVGREKHVMCIMRAQEFVHLATGEEGEDLDTHVLRLKAKFAKNKIIYLIEGLEPWMRKNKNLQNRRYVQEVRNQILEEAAAPMASQKRKKKPEMEHVDEDLVEDALLKLQVVHGVLIHHTKVQIETAEWVVIFTQHISTVRYRVQKQSLDTAFCMESGQVKTGDGPADTFTKMLQEMMRITASVAYGIAAEYPTVQKLVKGLKENGPLALQDCKKSANKDGAFTDRRVGPSISKRVYNVFVCRDAESWDV
ncbi:Essential meiotic endonuclease 1 [Hyphodiscus hymeniophilus]|uniref:Essential meiotic endonuclease 1 n=1 Tax=Hyphodiscus hymeniophilus TaxID=353542 RepID=A0A9P6VMY5_9HELO|nr:Essential meiotic endonuclease 1 [Hyphodiscus hymeniophilus]